VAVGTKPEFQEPYRQARREAFTRAVGRLQHAAEAAVSTLLRVMVDKDAPAGSRVRAAKCVLERGDTFVLEDLQARVAGLEQARHDLPQVGHTPAPTAAASSAAATPSQVRTPAGKLERMVLGLLEHGSPEKAAAALGISAATIRSWSRQSEFQERYCQVRREVFARSLARLQQAANAAVSTVLRTMIDKEAPAASWIRAAKCVLEYADRGRVEDLQARIDRLEQTRAER
jgi:predicted phosphohydrolase